MNRLETTLKAAILGGLGLMFYAKISDGTLTFYINQRFAWLSFAAVLILAALALTMVYRLIEGRRGKAEDTLREHIEQENHEHEHEHEHDHSHTHGVSWGAIIILSIPMLLGLLVPARPLGASAVSSRGIGLNAPQRAGSVVQAQRAVVGPKNILDWLRDFSRNPDPTTLNGQSVDVTGFVYRDPRNEANQIWVSRFAISCCVADASAVGLLVQTTDAAAFKNDSWIHVTGKLQAGTFAGEAVPVILPDKIEPTTQPENPYLYP
jgi:putative membrane protein